MNLRILALCLIIDSAAGCGDDARPATPGPDAAPPIDGPAMPIDAAPLPIDAPVDAPQITGRVRVVHAAPVATNLDIYLSGSTTPLFTNVAYGAATDYAVIPVGAIHLDVREAGAAATTAPLYSSDALDIAEAGRLTAVAAGLVGSTQVDTMFRIAGFTDHFAAPVPGKAHLRIAHDAYSMPSLAVDIGDDGTPEIATLARFTASDEAGVEVAAGANLGLSVKAATGGTTPLAAFELPAAALSDGAEVYAVVSGLTTFRARDPRAPRLLLVTAGKPALTVRLNPTIYVLGAAPDQAALDGFLGDAKSIDNLGFGALKSTRLRPTATGHALDLFPHTTAATRPGTPALASLSTGPLAAGDQYLVVLDGLVGDASLALQAFKDDLQLANDGFGKLRAVHAASGVPQLDVGRYDVANLAWHDIPEFANLAANTASLPAGTSIVDGNIAVPINPGVRVAGDPATAFRFGSPALGSTDRWFGVAAGAWTPVTGHLGLRFIVVKTAASTWTATVLTPLQSPPLRARTRASGATPTRR